MARKARLPRALPALLAGCSLLLTSACTDTPQEKNRRDSYDTLAEAINADDDISIVSDALRDGGLSQVFDGVASYTILAPSDEAFEQLGDSGEELRKPEERAAMIALLRDHILPGYLTPADIGRAIAQAPDGKVSLRTLGDHMLTFTSKAGRITVTTEDGLSARFAGRAMQANNGIAIPVDGLLKRVPARRG